MEYNELPKVACEALLIKLSQSIPELLQAVAPRGFANSPLTLVFHPAPEQQYKEYCQMNENTAHLQRARKKQEDITPAESFEVFSKGEKAEPVDEQYEMVSIWRLHLEYIFTQSYGF